MRLLLADIEEKRDDVLVLARRFRAEAGEQKEYYVGPGMASFELLTAIQEASADISAKSKEMKRAGGEIRRVRGDNLRCIP